MTMPEQKLNQLREIAMTASERDALRHKLHAFAIANAPARSLPLRTWRWAARHGAFVLGLALVFIAGGTGVSAERSMPGDLLYGFRLSVNDRIESALAFSDDSQIDVEMSQMQRMIDEEEAVRDDELTALAFEAAQDTDEDFEDEFERELREIERELNEQLRVQEEYYDDAGDAEELLPQRPLNTPDSFDAGEFEEELRSIERELREEERSRLELE